MANVLENMDIVNRGKEIIKTMVSILIWVVGWAIVSKLLSFVENTIKINKYLLYVVLLIVATIVLEKF